MNDMMTTPVKQKEEDQSRVTPTKASPCKVANEAVAKEAKGAPTVEKTQVPKAKAKAKGKGKGKGKAGTKDTSKADNPTEAGVAPKRKASNGVADSEAPKKRPAAKGHRSRARIPVPATEDEATTETSVAPNASPETSGSSFGSTSMEVSGVFLKPWSWRQSFLKLFLKWLVSLKSLAWPHLNLTALTTPLVRVQLLAQFLKRLECQCLQLETELPEVVSEVAGVFGVSGVSEVSGLAASDFDSVDNTSRRSQSSMARRHLSHLSMPWKHSTLMERAHLRQPF